MLGFKQQKSMADFVTNIWDVNSSFFYDANQYLKVDQRDNLFD